MRWLLDTNVLIDAFAGREHGRRALTAARAARLEWIGYSAVTRLEILGYAGLGAADEEGLRRLLAEFCEAPLESPVIEAAIQLRRSVPRLKIPDALIAATALVQRASLVTRNLHDFKVIPGLVVIDPTALP